MPLPETLARVDADLAAGRVLLARQRLRGLVSSYPEDLSLRRRLAQAYRLTGEPAQAGRWMYLEADRDPAETAAFEALFSSPLPRMRALAWRTQESRAATAFAAGQLASVRAAATDHTGRPVDWSAIPRGVGPGKPRSEHSDPLTSLLAIALFAAWYLGVTAFVRRLLH
ncbi:DUF6584 family protein [Streptomyces sp. NPDC048340]|uniref:DUF6584 family protein n=1 Tax=Streptomyces sp. NPDC048340 TaxID=3365537 RepID=UPI00371CAB19